jgi:TPP-dependent pyruvate/acetoin dehydrogenase alpha subunit
MAKPLSEHLADLSVRAKHAEDSVAAAKKEAHDKVVARKEKARAAAAEAAERVNNDIKSAENTATRNWNAVRAKVAADINSLKADVAKKA